MKFRESQPIYLQIADHVCEKVLLNEWTEGQRIPSVRELAITLAVNPNTVMRTYDFLEQQNIIYNERGIGFSVSEKGYKNALSYRRTQFSEKEMPFFFRNMVLLDMDFSELTPHFEKYRKKHSGELKKRAT
jgi:DNA-binding transcriptional regulator YhcF (GntR family)